MSIEAMVFLLVGALTVAGALLHLAQLRMSLGGLATPPATGLLAVPLSVWTEGEALESKAPAEGTAVDFDDVLRALGCEG